MNEEVVQQNTDFCLFKIKSLSQHRKIIEQIPPSKDMKAPSFKEKAWPGIREDPQTGNFVLGETQIPREMLNLEMEKPNVPEEFNKKVFALIEMAQDDARRSQKPINWCSWF